MYDNVPAERTTSFVILRVCGKDGVEFVEQKRGRVNGDSGDRSDENVVADTTMTVG